MPRNPPVAGEPLRMAVIGCGRIGRLHARANASSPLARLVAVCDCDAVRGRSLAADYGAKPYSTTDQLFAAETLDAVTLATPDHLHFAPAQAALAAGCHVFCEKPLAANLAEAEDLAAQADKCGASLGVDYNRRFAFGYRQARRLLDEGAIGRLESALVTVSDRTPTPEAARHPYVMFTTLLTHQFDLLRHFGGEIDRLHATRGRRHRDGLVKHVSLAVEFASGAIGTLVADYRDAQTRTSERFEVGGADGAIVVEDVTRRMILIGNDPDAPTMFTPDPFQAGDAFYESVVDHARAFIERVAHGEPPPVTGQDGVWSLRLSAAAVESLESGLPARVKSS